MSRTNVDVSTSENGSCRRQYFVNDVLVSDDPNYYVGTQRSLRILRQSNTTPYYKSYLSHLNDKKRKFPLLPMNDFFFEKSYVHNLFGSASEIAVFGGDETFFSGYRPNLYGAYDSYTGVGEYSTAEKVAFDDQARAKALSKIHDQKSNLAQVFAERHQTVDLFATTASRVAGVVSDLRKGNLYGAAAGLGISVSARKQRKFLVHHAKNPADAVANGWLELQYGWKPLLSDLYGSAELIAQANLREVIQRTTAVINRNHRPVTILRTLPVPAVVTVEESYTCKYVLYYTVTSDELHTLAQLGVLNPLYVAWELLPWSFVVDWFLPLGNWINSLDSTAGLTFNRGSKTTFNKRVTTVRVHGSALSGAATYGANLDGSEQYVRCRREVLSDFPSNILPHYKNPISKYHVANAMALLSQVFHGHKPSGMGVR